MSRPPQQRAEMACAACSSAPASPSGSPGAEGGGHEEPSPCRAGAAAPGGWARHYFSEGARGIAQARGTTTSWVSRPFVALGAAFLRQEQGDLARGAESEDAAAGVERLEADDLFWSDVQSRPFTIKDDMDALCNEADKLCGKNKPRPKAVRRDDPFELGFDSEGSDDVGPDGDDEADEEQRREGRKDSAHQLFSKLRSWRAGISSRRCSQNVRQITPPPRRPVRESTVFPDKPDSRRVPPRSAWGA